MGLVELGGGNAQVEVLDYNAAKEMAEVLHAAYPGHLWAVTCEGNNGIATIRNLALSGELGFVLKLKDIYSASAWKKTILAAAGEILERFYLRRGAANEDQITSVPIDFTGRSIGDYSKC